MSNKCIVNNVMAVSLDGKIGLSGNESDEERHSYGFANSDDHAHVAMLLQQADAVITGASSLRAAGKTWEVKNDQGKFPAWVVLTQTGIDTSLPFWSQNDIQRVLASKSIVQPEACKTNDVQNWVFPESLTARGVLSKCLEHGWTRILLFGGGVTNKMFYEEELVDFATITLSPMILGGLNAPQFVNSGLPRPVPLELLTLESQGNLVFLKYKVLKRKVF